MSKNTWSYYCFCYARDRKGNVVNAAHFEFQILGPDGSPIGKPITVRTEVGILLQCHPACDSDQIRYLVGIARETPDYPVDLCHWDGGLLVWSARIYYRKKGYASH